MTPATLVVGLLAGIFIATLLGSETSDVDTSVIMYISEIQQGELRLDCGVRQDVLDALSDVTLPDEDMTNLNIVRYSLARMLCDRDPSKVNTPEGHIYSASPRLPADDPCFSILGEKVFTNLNEKWLTDWYKPCVTLYLSSSAAPATANRSAASLPGSPE